MNQVKLKFIFKGHQEALKTIEHFQELIREAQATLPAVESSQN
jgi:hypothetical protein